MTDLYNQSVFINCPYDTNYNEMLHGMLFTVVTLGYVPRLSLESSDAGTVRLEKISQLISESCVSIHDLSRIRLKSGDEFARMNMPFELGLDFGCRKYSSDSKYCNKKFLIIGEKPYEYMRAISDLSGVDIEYHENDAYKLIKSIRHWFVKNMETINVPSPREIWFKFMDFNAEYVLYIRDKGYDDSEMYELPLVEQIQIMTKFLSDQPY